MLSPELLSQSLKPNQLCTLLQFLSQDQLPTLQLYLSLLPPIRFTTGLVILLRHTRELLDVLGLLQYIYD